MGFLSLSCWLYESSVTIVLLVRQLLSISTIIPSFPKIIDASGVWQKKWHYIIWSGKPKTIHIREFDENPHHYVHLRVHSAILPNRPDWSANEYYLGKYHFFHSIRERGRSGGVEYQIGRLAIGVRARECNCNRTMPNIGVNMFSSECQNPPVSSYILTKVIYNCLQIALPHIAYLVPGTACCSSKRACE